MRGGLSVGVQAGRCALFFYLRCQRDRSGMTEYKYTFSKGAITYTLTITRDEGGYSGKYTCPICKTTTEVDRVHTSQQEAVIKLQGVVYAQHHAPIHVVG